MSDDAMGDPEAPRMHGRVIETLNDRFQIKALRENAFNLVARIWKPTTEYYPNPWRYYTEFIAIAKRRGAQFITMSQALAGDYDEAAINILLDHHIDHYPIETEVMCRWELQNDVVSNVYLFNRYDYDDSDQRKIWRLENLNVEFYQELERSGFEIGYHQNAVGLVRNARVGRNYSKAISPDDAEAARQVFAEDVTNLRRYFNIRTFIPHGAGEANAQLTELPDGFDDLVWVYNNAKQGGSVPPPIVWRNFSDSVRMATQRMKGYRGQYAVRIDNLHLNAYLLEPGLNHVLVHPGRFSKGMPFDLYEDRGEPVTQGLRLKEFEGLSDVALPIRTSVMVKDWLRARGDEVPIAVPVVTTHKIYVLSDDDEVLLSYMAANDAVVPFRVVHRLMTPDEREHYRVPRPTPATLRLPTPDAPFNEAFEAFINVVFAKSILDHLADAGLPLDVLELRRLVICRIRDTDPMVELIRRVVPDGHIRIRAKLSVPNPAAWRDRLTSALEHAALLDGVTIGYEDVGGEAFIDIVGKAPDVSPASNLETIVTTAH